MSGEQAEIWQELQGVRVVELGGSLRDRLLVKLLADQGAEISCVGWTGHPDQQSAQNWSDGRQVQEFDLASSGGRDECEQLVNRADIFISSLPQASLESVGLDYKAVAAAQPSLLYCSMQGFPARADRAGDEIDGEDEWLIAAELGLDRLENVNKPEVEPLPLGSVFSAIQAAIYLAAALTARDRSGEGMFIEISLFGAAITTMGTNLVNVADPKIAALQGPPRLPVADRYMAADRAVHLNATVPSVMAGVLRAMDHEEWLAEAVPAIVELPDKAAEKAWRDRFAEVIRERTAFEWEDRGDKEGGAITVCRTREEWVAEPHAYDTDILRHNPGQKRPIMGPAVRIYPNPTAADPATATRHPATAAKGDENLPLAGKRVLDLSIIFAGPTCGRVLAELGADVIKVDSPRRSTPPYLGQFPWLDVQRSKRSILLDLTTAEGKEIFWRMIDQSDAILQNYRFGKLGQLGFSYEQVVARNPRIVYISLNAFDFGGPLSNRPGWEPNAQALTGMQMSRLKEPGGIPPRVPAPVNDFGTGFLGAYGAIVALRAAERTGRGQHVMCSLARTGSFIQTTELSWSTLDTAGQPSWLNYDVTFVECTDGWIAVRLDQGATLDDADRGSLSEATCESAMQTLHERGLRAVLARAPRDLLDLKWVRESGLVKTWEHPHWGTMTNVFARGSATGMEHRFGWPAPDPGQDTVQVLRDAGYSETEIEKFVADGIVRNRVPLFA